MDAENNQQRGGLTHGGMKFSHLMDSSLRLGGVFSSRYYWSRYSQKKFWLKMWHPCHIGVSLNYHQRSIKAAAMLRKIVHGDNDWPLMLPSKQLFHKCCAYVFSKKNYIWSMMTSMIHQCYHCLHKWGRWKRYSFWPAVKNERFGRKIVNWKCWNGTFFFPHFSQLIRSDLTLLSGSEL